MDSFKRWSENQYAVEELCLYLHERDISALCCVSKAWRKALNINPVWARIVTARGIFNQSLISRVNEDLGDFRVSEKPGDSRVKDDPGDYRVNEDLGDSRVKEDPGDYRGFEDPGDSRVKEDPGDSRVTEDSGNYRGSENPVDYGGSEDPGDYIDSEDSQSLEPSCYWARVLQYSAKLRYRWRNGEGVKTSFLIPECVKSSKIACFDADPDFLAVGTETGYLLVFNTKSKQLQYTNIVKQSKIEKLYVRHSKIVALQFGLIQVYNISSELNFIFCKSVESQTQISENSLDPFHVPKVSIQQMRSRRNGDVDISKLDLTVSAIGDQTLGLVKSGETSFYVYSLETGDCISRVESEKDEKILKIELVHVPGI